MDYSFPKEDVRYGHVGPLNRLINWIFMGNKPRILRRLFTLFLHIDLPRLEYPIKLPHPYCVVVNPRATLGRNVTVFQGVTIGSKRYGRNAGVPVIGDDVVVFPNAIIIGNVFIGNGATIGPGAVVVKDVPSGAVVVGNPSRIIKQAAATPLD